MKKQLSLILALVMILGTFTTAFAATDADAIADSSAFLKEKGILVGNMAGDLMLDENLSRQDTAILVSRLMGEYDVAKNFPTAENIPTYNDIDDPFYLPVLAWAQANKTFVGHSDARFGFDDNVTAQEYAKVLLVALGYEVGPETAKDLTWEATLPKAKDLGILKDIDTNVKNTDEITRGEMAVMTFNALSVMMKDGTKTLAEELGITMPAATKLTAEVKDTMNLKEVVINLSNAKLADADKLMDVANYRIDGVKVKDVTVKGNDVILLLEEALIKGREYKLTVANIETGLNGTYNFKAADNTLPTVEEVTVLGEYGIKVTTSEPIRDAKERNFLVDGRNVSMNIEMYGRDLILTPYYNESFPSDAKTLTIKEIEDYAGLKATEKDFDIKIVRDDVAPKVTDVVSRGNKVEVTFDKDIYKNSVADYSGRTSTGNISYQSGRQTIYADDAEKVDTNKVVYTFEREMPRRTSVTISGVQNHSKVAMASVTQMPREELDYSEPAIIEKDVETTDTKATIKLKFNKNVEGIFIDKDNKKAGFQINNHFTLYERDVYRGQEVEGKIQSARYALDRDGKIIKDTVIVEITGLTKYTSANDLNYVLEVENFTDETSLRNKMYRDYVDFKATSTSPFKIDDVEVDKYTKTTEIKIKFTKPVDKAVAEQNTNYLFKEYNSTKLKDVKELKGEVYAEENGKTVTIILPSDTFRVEDFETMTILNSLKDKDGNRLDDLRVYHFKEGVLVLPGDSAQDTLNKAVAQRITNQIKELPAAGKVTLADERAIEAARTAYDDLTDDQKAYVPQAQKDALVAAEQELENLKNNAENKEKADKVISMIKALPSVENVETTDEAEIRAARDEFEALSNAQKALVPTLDKTKLNLVEDRLNDLLVLRVESLINALPDAADVELDDAQDINAARAAYDTLVDAGLETEIDGTDLAKLVDAEAALAVAIDVDMVNKELNKVPNSLVLQAGTDLTQDQSNVVDAQVKNSVDLTKVNVTVTKDTTDTTGKTYNVELTSKDTIASKDDKDITVTVAQ